METFKIETFAGNNFTDVSKDAKELATSKSIVVEFEFNGVTCLVSKYTDLNSLHRDYMNSWTMKWKTVGPDCVAEYSPETRKELERRKKIEEEESVKRQKEYQVKVAKETEQFNEKVEGIKLELSDKEKWEKSRSMNSDGYGKAALDYAEGWAKLMQIEIDNGKSIEECYDYTQKGLGFFGITGFQFGCAVSVLSEV